MDILLLIILILIMYKKKKKSLYYKINHVNLFIFSNKEIVNIIISVNINF